MHSEVTDARVEKNEMSGAQRAGVPGDVAFVQQVHLLLLVFLEN